MPPIDQIIPLFHEVSIQTDAIPWHNPGPKAITPQKVPYGKDPSSPWFHQVEDLINQRFATGLSWDVGAGSRGLSRRGVAKLLELSREPTIGIDAELPLLLLGREGFEVGFRACEGLEFETADRFGAEIEAAGGYDSWEAEMCANPARWLFRLRVALLIAEAAVRYGRRGETL